MVVHSNSSLTAVTTCWSSALSSAGSIHLRAFVGGMFTFCQACQYEITAHMWTIEFYHDLWVVEHYTSHVLLQVSDSEPLHCQLQEYIPDHWPCCMQLLVILTVWSMQHGLTQPVRSAARDIFCSCNCIIAKSNAFIVSSILEHSAA